MVSAIIRIAHAWLVVSILTGPSRALGELPEVIEKLAEYENTANNDRVRSDWHIKIPYYEIPLEFVWREGFESLPLGIQNTLVVKRNGRMYFRWFVHPEDNSVGPVLEDLLKSDQKIEKKESRQVAGAYTASRSLFLGDGATYFSLKVGTDQLMGERQRKRYTASEARWSYTASEYFRQRQDKLPNLEHLIILRELAAFGVRPEAIQGRPIANSIAMSVRDLTPLAKKGHLYVPGFSILDERLGRKIAAENGSANPGEYWRENLCKPVAKALAELFLKFGVTLDSPHGQNILLEMRDVQGKLVPTGRVVLRDMMDIRVVRELIEPFWGRPARTFAKVVGVEPEVVVKGKVPIEMWLLGFRPDRNAPTWLTPNEYETWGQEFFGSFEQEMERGGLKLSPARFLVERAPDFKFARKFRKNYSLPDNWEKTMVGEAGSCIRLEQTLKLRTK